MGEFCAANPDLGKLYTLWHSACSGPWKNVVQNLNLYRVITKPPMENVMISQNVKHSPKDEMIMDEMEN